MRLGIEMRSCFLAEILAVMASIEYTESWARNPLEVVFQPAGSIHIVLKFPPGNLIFMSYVQVRWTPKFPLVTRARLQTKIHGHDCNFTKKMAVSPSMVQEAATVRKLCK